MVMIIIIIIVVIIIIIMKNKYMNRISQNRQKYLPGNCAGILMWVFLTYIC